MARLRSTLLVVLSTACGGAPSAQTPRTPPRETKPAPVAAILTLEEKTACAPGDDAAVDSLACLVAERARLDAGDAAGAKAVLAYGCDHGDVDACVELATLDQARASELRAKATAACKALGEAATKRAACVRGHTTEVVSAKEIGAALPFALALDLRARHVPRLLGVLDAAERACRAAVAAPSVATLANTPVAKDASLVDAAISCSGLDLSKTGLPRDGLAVSTDFTVRSLHDAILSSEGTLRVSAPTGRGESGVFCPSRLVDDDRTADVWMKVETGGITTLVIAAVKIEQPCRSSESQAAHAKEKAALHALLSPVLRVVDDALDKLAERCDAPIPTLSGKSSPLAGHPIEHTPHIVSFEPHCVFGFRSIAFDTKKPLSHPNPMTSSHEFIRVGDFAARVEAIEGRPGMLEFTLRRRNGELVVGVHK